MHSDALFDPYEFAQVLRKCAALENIVRITDHDAINIAQALEALDQFLHAKRGTDHD